MMLDNRGSTSVEGLGFATNPSTKWKQEQELTRSINVKVNLFYARRKKSHRLPFQDGGLLSSTCIFSCGRYG